MPVMRKVTKTGKILVLKHGVVPVMLPNHVLKA